MRTFIFLLTFLVAGCQTARVSNTSHGTATIQQVKGPADIRHAGGKWERARAGQILSTGDEARTAAGGQVDFRLRENGGVLTLMPNSLLEFEQLGPKTASDSVQAVLNLPAGRVVGDTLKMPGGTKIVVKTPKGVSEIP
jgi:hypothetical protein